MAKRQRTTMSTTTMRTMLTTRMTSPDYCSTSNNSYDSFYHFYDYVTIGEDDQYRERYTIYRDTSKT
eukprot:198346-Amphidinium_carterae.6